MEKRGANVYDEKIEKALGVYSRVMQFIGKTTCYWPERVDGSIPGRDAFPHPHSMQRRSR